VVLVFHDVGARRELERQLRDRAERLAEADRRKDDFLAMLAHELRNPLAPIRNSLYVLEVSPHDAQIVEEMRDIMRRQIEHLVRLVDDLLDVTRITRGVITLRKERVDLVKIVRQSLIDHRRRAELSGLALAQDLPDGPIWLDADPTRVKQVVDNLLGNALKFTDRGGAVMVSVAADAAGEATLSVRDTGIGIDEAILPQIFEPFAQADRSLDRSRGGLGLGLALVRGLIELHGGSVQARSEGLGRGCEFTVRLGIGGAPADEAQTPPKAPTATTRRCVLIIEDHRDSAETLRRILSIRGYDVAVVHQGADGIAEVRRSRPDVVLCDIGLPGMDGYAVASALRAEPAGARARLIALSGYGRAEDLERARAAGFDDHIVKPADPDELIRKIEGRCQRA
jgi:CheY-like chemotaxis protein/nitrogen-specific signal transduction histidine kinase